jgi:hypothetical protein
MTCQQMIAYGTYVGTMSSLGDDQSKQCQPDVLTNAHKHQSQRITIHVDSVFSVGSGS